MDRGLNTLRNLQNFFENPEKWSLWENQKSCDVLSEQTLW